MTLSDIPSGLWPHFQEYDVQTLDLDRDANLIIQPNRWGKSSPPFGISVQSVVSFEYQAQSGMKDRKEEVSNAKYSRFCRGSSVR